MEKKKHPTLNRRNFLTGASALACTGINTQFVHGAKNNSKKYRVAVIGHTGRGNYGHYMDKVWLKIPGAEIIAVADPDERGRAKVVKHLGARKGFADYHQMLKEVKPDFVTICPRWLDQHKDMVVAAAEGNVKGIYLEKPMCRTPAEADEMISACEKNNVKLAIAHQTRYSPKLPVVQKLIRSGAIGEIMELRGRGKEDHRGGGEDLWVLGTHILNLINVFGGEPEWCFGKVYSKGKPITGKDVKPGSEGIGPLAGDSVHAEYRLIGCAIPGGPSRGIMAHFDSIRNCRGNPSRFGLTIYGSRGIIKMYTGYLPGVFLLTDSSWSPGKTNSKWVPVSSKGVGEKEPLKDGGLLAGNVLALKDLIDAVEKNRQPVSNIYEARTAVEMIASVFESQRVGKQVAIPLKKRENPLTMLKETHSLK